jgi:formylglycine-generating enzyme
VAEHPAESLLEYRGEKWHEPDPFGMVFVPLGHFMMGPNDEDVMFAQNAFSRTVSVDAFWMDETEITNNKYRQFVYWVRDSIMRRTLADYGYDEFLITTDEFDREMDEPRLNWRTRGLIQEMLMLLMLWKSFIILRGKDFITGRRLDTRKLTYEYFWVDYEQAARRSNRWNPETQQYEGTVLISSEKKCLL